MNPWESARKYAKYHNLHWNTVYRWIRLGLIPCTAHRCTVRTRYYIRLTEPEPDLRPGPVDRLSAQAAALAGGRRVLHTSVSDRSGRAATVPAAAAPAAPPACPVSHPLAAIVAAHVGGEPADAASAALSSAILAASGGLRDALKR